MVTANLPGFAPSCDGAAELFFVNVKHRGIRRHIIHDLFQRLKRHWRTGIAQVFTFTLTYYLDDRLVGRGIYQLTSQNRGGYPWSGGLSPFACPPQSALQGLPHRIAALLCWYPRP